MQHHTRPTMHWWRTALVLAAAAVIAACGGDDASSDGDSPEPTVGAQSDETGAGSPDQEPPDGQSAAEGPVDGVVVSLSDFGLGLFAVNEDGTHRELSMDGVDFTDRNAPAIVADEHAYILTLTAVEGQTFTHHVGIGRVDLATGAGTEIVRLGLDRPDDESTEGTRFELVGAGGGVVWAHSRTFGNDVDSMVTLHRFDANTGESLGELAGVRYDVELENAQCSADVVNLQVLPDGTLIGTVAGWPATVDSETGAVTPLVDYCGVSPDDLVPFTLGGHIGEAELDEFVVTDDGQPVAADRVEHYFSTFRTLDISDGEFALGNDGHLWWHHSTVLSGLEGEQRGILGAVVRFDPSVGAIVEVHPLGEAAGRWLPEDATFDVATLSGADLTMVDDDLWIVDPAENASLLRLDPGTGTLDSYPVPVGDAELTDVELLGSTPGSLWLEVNRAVVTADDETGRSTAGTLFIDRVDTATGEFVLSTPVSEIIGFG